MSMIHALIIEDSSMMAAVLNQYLSMYQGSITFTYEIVGTLSKAVTRLKGGDLIDVSVLDLNLPDSNGTFSVIRLFSEVPEIPIVVMTGEEKPGLRDKCIKEGAAGFIHKAEITTGKMKVEEFVSYLWQAVLKREQVHAVFKEYGNLKQEIKEQAQMCRDARNKPQE